MRTSDSGSSRRGGQSSRSQRGRSSQEYSRGNQGFEGGGMRDTSMRSRRNYEDNNDYSYSGSNRSDRDNDYVSDNTMSNRGQALYGNYRRDDSRVGGSEGRSSFGQRSRDWDDDSWTSRGERQGQGGYGQSYGAYQSGQRGREQEQQDEYLGEHSYSTNDDNYGSRSFGGQGRRSSTDESESGWRNRSPSYRQENDEDWNERSFGSFRGNQDYPREFYDDDDYEESYGNDDDSSDSDSDRDNYYRRNVGRTGSGLRNLDDYT